MVTGATIPGTAARLIAVIITPVILAKALVFVWCAFLWGVPVSPQIHDPSALWFSEFICYAEASRHGLRFTAITALIGELLAFSGMKRWFDFGLVLVNTIPLADGCAQAQGREKGPQPGRGADEKSLFLVTGVTSPRTATTSAKRPSLQPGGAPAQRTRGGKSEPCRQKACPKNHGIILDKSRRRVPR